MKIPIIAMAKVVQVLIQMESFILDQESAEIFYEYFIRFATSVLMNPF